MEASAHMHWFLAEDDKYLVIRLDQGDFLLEGVEEAARMAGVTDGFVASCIGTLDVVKMHFVMTTEYPAVESYPTLVGPFELNSLSGIIADGKLHGHLMITDSEKAYGGHLEAGTRVLYLAEIVVRNFKGTNMKRTLDTEKGIRRLTDCDCSD